MSEERGADGLTQAERDVRMNKLYDEMFEYAQAVAAKLKADWKSYQERAMVLGDIVKFTLEEAVEENEE